MSAYKLANATASAGCDAMAARCNGGTFGIYSGAQPADADTAIGAQVLLATLTFGTPAFAAAVNGVATANAIASDSAADATGTAAWLRAFTSGGAPVGDGVVGVTGSGSDLEVATVSFVANAQIVVTALTLTLPKS